MAYRIEATIEFLGDATSRLSLLALFPLLRTDSLGSLRRWQSAVSLQPYETRFAGFPSPRLFSAHQRPPLRIKIADPQTIGAELLAEEGDQVGAATSNRFNLFNLFPPKSLKKKKNHLFPSFFIIFERRSSITMASNLGDPSANTERGRIEKTVRKRNRLFLPFPAVAAKAQRGAARVGILQNRKQLRHQ